jgi:hypothetical protein
MSSNDVLCAVQRKLSNFVQNWDLHRPYLPSLAVRTEGFTEEWGKTTQCANQDEMWLQWEQEQVAELCATQQPASPVRLVQYRPAWMEQLALRVAGVPHIVLNSAYAVSELTGPLPYLQDLGTDGTDGKSSDTTAQQCPAMVGRTHSALNSTVENAILDYLKQHRGIDLDRTLNDLQNQQSVLFTLLIRDTLTPCLTLLRYQADTAAWEQIYRPQCMAAAAAASSNNSWYKPLASWQAWSERVQALSSLTRQHRSQSRESTITTARRAYAVVEQQLQNTSRSSYLLDTAKPVVVDCLLWDHLLQAVTDIHLVVVLADFPAILQYIQKIWDTFQFGAAVDDNTTIRDSLSVWNFEENASNAFNEIPLLPARVKKENETFQHAIDLMEKISVAQHDLQKTLILAKKQRLQDDALTKTAQRQPLATWHRWRMGDSYFPASRGSAPPTTSDTTATTATEELMRRAYQRNDEIWMASVAAITIAIVLGFGFAGNNRQ